MGDRSCRKTAPPGHLTVWSSRAIYKLKKKTPVSVKHALTGAKAAKLAFPFLRSRPRWASSWVRPFSHLVSMRKNGLRNRQADLQRCF